MRKKLLIALLASELFCGTLAAPLMAQPNCGPETGDKPNNVLVPQQYLTALDYNGTWYRTDIPSSDKAKLFIKAIDEGSFTYHIICNHGGNTGERSGNIVLNSRGMGVENIKSGNAEGHLVFLLGQDEIFIDYLDDLSALDFGNGVTPAGTYKKSKPCYTSEHNKTIILPEPQAVNLLENSLPPVLYNNLMLVFQDGTAWEMEPYHYHGMIAGTGMSANLYFSENKEYFYLLTDYLSEDNDKDHAFFTNDPKYSRQLPHFYKDADAAKYKIVFIKY